ncbi:hypothetical protein V2G26_002217 [Clonostachys chloroleuca]
MATGTENSVWLDAAVLLPDEKIPVKFSRTKKLLVAAAGLVSISNSALASSLPSGAASEIVKDFKITNPLYPVLLNSVFMIGFAFGPLVFGPLSEHIGRRLVIIGTYVGYMIFTICCAVSPSYSALIFFRFLCGVAASSPNVVVGPIYADIFDIPEERGNAVSIYGCVTAMLPPFGPIISGYVVEKYSWRLSFWIALAISGVFLPLILWLPETYIHFIRRQHMKRNNIELAVVNDPYGKEQPSLREELKIVFARPFIMIVKEPVVLFTGLYLSLIYATLYLFFQSYFIIYQGVYGLSAGEVGLTFLPVSGGSLSALFISLWYTSYHRRCMLSGAEWAMKIEYRRLPLACFGGPLIIISLFWLGWTSFPWIHPAVPAMSGLLFGAGYIIIFMSLLNYVTDAYREFSASAQASMSTMRSITAVCLPLAAPQMYGNLGIQWACSLLGFITLILAIIPFAFIKYGEKLRKKSPFCQQLAT